jgi:hypothetical protein
MKPRAHLIASAAVGAMLYQRQPWKAVLVTLGGVLIDVDHYLLFALRSGDWNPYSSVRYNHYRHNHPWRGDHRPRFGSLRSLLHQRAFGFSIAALIAWYAPKLRPLAWALALHLLMDIPRHHFDWQTWQRMRGRCAGCGAAGLRLGVFRLALPHPTEQNRVDISRITLCPHCSRAVLLTYTEAERRALLSRIDACEQHRRTL